MEIRRVCALFWSATGNTKTVTEAVGKKMAEVLKVPFETFDFTPAAARAAVTEFAAGDAVVVGAPTYAGKLPNKILPDFQTKLVGNGAAAAAVVTFGNRSYDNSLAELTATLAADGFLVMGGAAFACRHAFTDRLAFGRPGNEADLGEAAAFGEKTAELLGKTDAAGFSPVQVPGDAAAPYYVPKGTDGMPAKFLKAKPLTDRAKCTNCGDCVKLCPVNSIDPADVANVPGICIKCQACVRGCRTGAKYFEDAAFLSHVAMLEQNFTAPKKNEFFYAE